MQDSLTRAGVSEVFILDGGLNAWRQLVGPLEGDALAQRRLNRITAQQFFPEKDNQDWAVIDVSGWEVSAGRAGNMADEAPADSRATGLGSFLAVELHNKAPEARRVLIVNEDGTGYEAVELAVAELGWIHVF